MNLAFLVRSGPILSFFRQFFPDLAKIDRFLKYILHLNYRQKFVKVWFNDQRLNIYFFSSRKQTGWDS